MFVAIDLKKSEVNQYVGDSKLKDMNELQESLNRKKTGIPDIKLLAAENPDQLLNPAQKILARTVKVRLVDLDQTRQ